MISVFCFHAFCFNSCFRKSSARPKAHALAQKHDGWRPDNGCRPDRRRNLLQRNLQNGQGRQLADDRFGFGVCFQRVSILAFSQAFCLMRFSHFLVAFNPLTMHIEPTTADNSGRTIIPRINHRLAQPCVETKGAGSCKDPALVD